MKAELKRLFIQLILDLFDVEDIRAAALNKKQCPKQL